MSNVIATDVQTQEIDSGIVELFEITLPTKPVTTMYFHAGLDSDLTDVRFKSSVAPASGQNYEVNDYEPMPMLIDGLELQADGASNRPSITVANIGTLFSAEMGGLKNDDLIGERIVRRQTLRKYLDGGSGDTGAQVAGIEFRKQEYVIDRIASENSISTTFELAAPFDLEGIQLPRRVVVGKYCSWQYQGHDTTATGGCTWKKDGALNYEGTNGTYAHNGYFDINDSALIPTESAFAAYANATAYTEVSYVTHSGSYWQCIIAGTGNEPSSTSSFWREAFMWTEHANLTVYALGARVRYGDAGEKTIWKALRAHTSIATIVPVSKGSYWVREDVCGKTLNSCKCRYGFKPTGLTATYQKPNGQTNGSARLPFGSFPGTLKF